MSIDIALERVPDEPWRIDTRGMLLSGRADVSFPRQPEAAADGFIVCLADTGLVSIVGRPPRDLIQEIVGALDGDVTVLCQPTDASYVARSFAGWRRTNAVLLALCGRPDWADGDETGARIFSLRDAPRLTHLPARLRAELTSALSGRPSTRGAPGELPDADLPPVLDPISVAASWAGQLPVSFCYPALRTERWWDVSIETLLEHRRQGHGARAVRTMTRYMWQTGRWPVWGAPADNLASLSLARSLGFEEVGRLAVFSTPDRGWGGSSLENVRSGDSGTTAASHEQPDEHGDCNEWHERDEEGSGHHG
jgi:hypothetical protein